MKKIDSICLVDDDEIFQFLAHEVIQSTDLVGKVKTFSNGFEAISFLESVKDNPGELPEVILLDLFMPVMDGWGFLEKYLQLKPYLKKKITIYIVTSSIDPADVQKATSNSDVSGFVIKPLTRDKFLNTINLM